MFSFLVPYILHKCVRSKRGVNAALALKRLRNLSPEISRRLFNSRVSPVVDYALLIWALACTRSSLDKLNVIQKIGGQAIIGRFKTVARNVIEVDVEIDTVESRHLKQIRSAWVKWHTRPLTHRFWKVKAALCMNNKRWISPFQKIATILRSIDVSKEETIGFLQNLPLCRVRNDLVGIGVAWQNLPLENISNTNSTLLSLTSSLAELAAVEGALAKYYAAISGKKISPNNLTI